MNKSIKSDFPQKYPIGPDPISEEKLNKILTEELYDWKIVQSPLPENPFIERKELYREYLFENFDKVIEFINKVAVGCNIFPHHPRWENTWTTLRIFLTTWDVKHIISYKDIMLARFLDKTFLEFSSEPMNDHTKRRTEAEKQGFVKNITQLIGEDNLEEVFSRISDYSTLNREKNISKELVLLTAKFNGIQNAKRIGRITWKESEQEIVPIRLQLLDLLTRMD